MPSYQVGDRVKVTNDTKGQPIELIDAVGTVTVVEPLTQPRVQNIHFRGDPEYTVDFDDVGLRDGIWEHWLLPESI